MIILLQVPVGLHTVLRVEVGRDITATEQR